MGTRGVLTFLDVLASAPAPTNTRNASVCVYGGFLIKTLSTKSALEVLRAAGADLTLREAVTSLMVAAWAGHAEVKTARPHHHILKPPRLSDYAFGI